MKQTVNPTLLSKAFVFGDSSISKFLDADGLRAALQRAPFLAMGETDPDWVHLTAITNGKKLK